MGDYKDDGDSKMGAQMLSPEEIKVKTESENAVSQFVSSMTHMRSQGQCRPCIHEFLIGGASFPLVV